MNNKQLVKKYYDDRAECQVLGILMKEPKKIKGNDYHLEQDDFKDGLHATIFTSIYNLTYQGVEEIKISEIETYLANNNPIGYSKIFEKSNGLEWLSKILDDANEINFNYYYNIVKKRSLLRSYINQGLDVRDILDEEVGDAKLIKEQMERFEKISIEDIIKIMDKKNIDAKRRFVTYKDSDRKKAGIGAKDYRQSLKDNPPFGLGLESEYLNTIFRGANRKKFMLESRGTGMGKSRSGLGRIANFCSQEIFSFEHNDFIPNPNGVNNNGLYIGTEMELLEEVEPILWSIVAGVDQDKIMNNITTKEEDMRIEKAIEIIDKSCMHLIYEPNFNSEVIEQYIEEYKLDYNIGYTFFDYLMITDELVSESSRKRGGLSVRDDVALLQLSSDLKRMAKDYDIFLQSCTQISGDWKNSDNRDQTILRGSRAIADKADLCMITMSPTKKELEKIEPILKNCGLIGQLPNMVHSIYKNRGGSINGVKVWGHQDLGTMKWTDLFCTNNNYERININPTQIKVENNKIITL